VVHYLYAHLKKPADLKVHLCVTLFGRTHLTLTNAHKIYMMCRQERKMPHVSMPPLNWRDYSLTFSYLLQPHTGKKPSSCCQFPSFTFSLMTSFVQSIAHRRE